MNKKSNPGIGTFDFYKGIALLLVVMWHTIPFLEEESLRNIHDVGVSLHDQWFGVAIGGFFIISGFGIRKRPIKKYVIQQFRFIAKPYLIASISAILINTLFRMFVINDVTYIDIVKIDIKMLAGFLLALPDGGLKYLKLEYFSCGPLWYLVAMIGGSIITLWILTIDSERTQRVLVVIISLFSSVLSIARNYIPFCLCYILFSVVFIYTGYQFKKKRLFFCSVPWWGWIIGLLDILAVKFLAIFNISDFFRWMVLYTLSGWILSILTIYIGIYFGKKENFFTSSFASLGKRSLLFLCVHTVEMIGIPWWDIAVKLHTNTRLGICDAIIIFFFRMTIIVMVCILIERKKMIYANKHFD